MPNCCRDFRWPPPTFRHLEYDCRILARPYKNRWSKQSVLRVLLKAHYLLAGRISEYKPGKPYIISSGTPGYRQIWTGWPQQKEKKVRKIPFTGICDIVTLHHFVTQSVTQRLEDLQPWKELVHSQKSAMATPGKQIHSTNPVDEDGTVWCRCGKKAVIKTSHTQANPDRWNLFRNLLDWTYMLTNFF